MTNLFRGSLEDETFDLNGLDISSATSVTDMFSDNPNLKSINIEGVDLSKLSISTLLTLLLPNSIEKIDISSLDKTGTLSYSNGYGTFNAYPGRTNLKELIIPNVSFTLSYQGYFFADSPLEIVKIGSIKGTYYGSTSYAFKYHTLFSGRTKLKDISINNLIFTSTDAANTNLASFFSGCTSLENFDFGETDTSLNPTIASMFQNCKAITSVDLSWMTTTSTTNASYLFNGCSNLKTFDFTG